MNRRIIAETLNNKNGINILEILFKDKLVESD